MPTQAETQSAYEDQRAAQIAVKGAFLAQFVPLYDLIDFEDIDGSKAAWTEAALASIRQWRQRSADVAVKGYRSAKRLFLPGKATISTPTISMNWAAADRAALKSLAVTGPSELKRQIGLGLSEDEAKQNGLTAVSGAASRQVLNGGRDQTIQMVAADPQAVGWVRVTSGSPCAFCLMLASRGPAYKSQESAGFQAHDHCSCTAVPVFSEGKAAWPQTSIDAEKVYRKVARGAPDPLAALRRHLHDEAKRAKADQPTDDPRQLASLIKR